jgi:starch synthase
VIGVVSRFVGQKGLDLVAELVPALPRLGAKLVVLGSGSPVLEERFHALARRYPDHLAIKTAFDGPLAQRIYAGADIFLVPSRFEPCGLTQLQSMAYGTIPVVRAVGGLADTVLDPHVAGKRSTGFLFFDFEVSALHQALSRAVRTYRNAPNVWRRLQINGMTRDATWEKSARRYRGLYEAVQR